MPAFQVDINYRTRLRRSRTASEVIEADTKEELDQKVLNAMVAVDNANPGAIERGMTSTRRPA